jgi:hypothetical protein
MITSGMDVGDDEEEEEEDGRLDVEKSVGF